MLGERWTFAAGTVLVQAKVITDSLATPSGMLFLPDGRILATNRSAGSLVLVDTATGARTTVEGLPDIYHVGDAGTLDVALHPRYRDNGFLYILYSIDLPGGSMPVVDRATLSGRTLANRTRIYEARPVIENGHHHGGRLVFHDGFLFVGIGDHNARDLGQYPGDPYGKILRLRDDGTPAPGNPFAGREDAATEIWSLGHRNPQGLAIDVRTGMLWAHEHGPRGGDEINIIQGGRNYGWPIVTHGEEYYRQPIGKGLRQRPGMEDPVHVFTPTVAPSGMLFYTGDAFPAWRNSLFIGGMAARSLIRFDVNGRQVSNEERLLTDKRWRVRNVIQGPDGFLYLGVDGGGIIRLSPRP